MKKRYTLDQDVICHIFKSGTRGNKTVEPNDGSGGHAVQDIITKISAYKILSIPIHKKSEADTWKSATLEQARLCPFPHVATFTFNNVTYTKKSMFPGHLKKEDVIKTIERALTSPTSGHTYAKSSVQRDGKDKTVVSPQDWRRQISDKVIDGGDYVEGKANGITVRGQVKGHAKGQDLTSAFPNTIGFFDL